MAKTNGKTVRDTEVRPLPVKLTEPELVKRGDEMASCELKIEELKASRSAINGEISGEVKRRAELAHVIDSGVETREVRCEWQPDFAKNVFRLVRLDLGATIDTRAMSADDRVGDLFDAADQTEDMAPPPRSPKPKAAKATKAKPRAKQAGPNASLTDIVA